MSDNPLLPREWLSPKEFAAASGLALPTVYRYLKAGRLPKFQPFGENGRVCIPRSALNCMQLAAEPSQPTSPDLKATKPERMPGPTPRWMKNSGASIQNGKTKNK